MVKFRLAASGTRGSSILANQQSAVSLWSWIRRRRNVQRALTLHGRDSPRGKVHTWISFFQNQAYRFQNEGG